MTEVEQLRLLLELDELLRPLSDAGEITLAVATFLGQKLHASRCAFADVEPDQRTFNLTANYVDGVATLVGRHDAAVFGADFMRAIQAGRIWTVPDTENDPRCADARDAFRAARIASLACVPVHKQGRLVAGMGIHQSVPRTWTATEIKLLEIVAHRCWESMERTRVARELRDSEAKFRIITNAMPQMVWTATPEGMVDYHNDQVRNFSGVPASETGGTEWVIIVHPDDLDRATRQWRRSVRTGEPYECTYRVLHRSGEYQWTLARGLPMRDADGRIVKWLGTNTLIHEHKLAQDALADSNRRKDEFLSMLAHELRNPLAPINAAAELLSIQPEVTPPVAQASEVIRRQVAHMSRLVDDLLEVSRVTRGLVRLDMHPIDLRRVIDDAIEQAKPLLDARGHALALALPDAALPVDGDHARLVQVLANVLGNAAKYTPQGGSIALRARRDGARSVVEVTDNGIGMSPDLLEHVFDLFQQGERTRDRSEGGLGIGLALVKSLVHQHGGEVVARSDGPGRGSCFTITLPCSTAAAMPVETPGAQASVPAASRRVLLVDDNRDAADTMAALLRHSGHRVWLAADAASALALARQQPFDVYLLDIGLPDTDGYELLRQMRHAGIAGRFVALTGYRPDQAPAAGPGHGFDAHLVKPVETARLLQMLQQA